MASSMHGTMVVLALALACGAACVPTPGEDDDGTGSTSDASTTTAASTAGEGPSSTSEDPTVTSTSGPSSSSASASSDSSSSLDGTTETPACELPPLEQDVVDQLYIGGGQGGNVAAGSDVQLVLAWIDNGFPSQVEACVEWSIEPVDGVAIDASGLLMVDAAVPAGTTISVSADVEDGRRIVLAEFAVYIPLESEILGYWMETQQLPCGGGAPFEPDPIIGELVFQDTGEFSVTWTPFEVYYDYWGTFTYDEASDALVLTVEGGNYVPDDIDGEGTATIVDGVLTLEDMWLGVAQTPVTPVACGHVFE